MLDELAALIASAAERRRPTLVGLTGPVAVGKTTMTAAIAGALHGLAVDALSTDGFLFPNTELETRGLLLKKGFPESFDTAALNAFLDAARAGTSPLVVPVYDHLCYDIVGHATVDVRDVLIVEGVNTLLPDHVGRYDVTIYVDAPDDVIFEWFAARLHELVREAAANPSSFYAPFSSWSDDQIRDFARTAWDGINAINLDEHIRPARERASVVIEKNDDHSIRSVTVR